jgi:hypothetical protein
MVTAAFLAGQRGLHRSFHGNGRTDERSPAPRDRPRDFARLTLCYLRQQEHHGDGEY